MREPELLAVYHLALILLHDMNVRGMMERILDVKNR